MFRRQAAAGSPAYEPKGCPNGATPRRSSPLLPRLFTLDVCTGREPAGAWWQPYLSPGPRGRGTTRALLLPPLLPSSMAQKAGARGAGARGARVQGAGTRGAGVRGTRQPAARDDADILGALLGKVLPTKFRYFLHQLRAKCAEPKAHPTSEPQYPEGASEHYLGLGCPSYSLLPDLWDQSSLHSEDSFTEKPTLGPPRGEFITARKANPPSGEGSRPRRRYCPFRVRFADETLQDTALRYWERNRAVRQNIFSCEQTTLPAVSVSERVLGSVGRWLESLPRTMRSRTQDTVAGSSCCNYPRVSAQEPQLHLSEDATMSSRLPFISRATTMPRPPGGLRTFLDTANTVEQVLESPGLLQAVFLDFLSHWSDCTYPSLKHPPLRCLQSAPLSSHDYLSLGKGPLLSGEYLLPEALLGPAQLTLDGVSTGYHMLSKPCDCHQGLNALYLVIPTDGETEERVNETSLLYYVEAGSGADCSTLGPGFPPKLLVLPVLASDSIFFLLSFLSLSSSYKSTDWTESVHLTPEQSNRPVTFQSSGEQGMSSAHTDGLAKLWLLLSLLKPSVVGVAPHVALIP
ncbi:hypothetical protein STEG23_001892, partial [Scotinomys teguina]